MKFAVKFLGCKVSQADAMLARRQLLEAGHEEVPEAEAELHVINTCCITSEAEAKSRQSVRRSLKTAREVYVGGCAVNLRPMGFAEIAPAVKVFTGAAEEVASAMASTEPRPQAATGACIDVERDLFVHQSGQRSKAWSGTRTRGFVKVQDGCDCHCAYCIIPSVRGSARSRATTHRRDDAVRAMAVASVLHLDETARAGSGPRFGPLPGLMDEQIALDIDAGAGRGLRPRLCARHRRCDLLRSAREHLHGGSDLGEPHGAQIDRAAAHVHLARCL